VLHSTTLSERCHHGDYSSSSSSSDSSSSSSSSGSSWSNGVFCGIEAEIGTYSSRNNNPSSNNSISSSPEIFRTPLRTPSYTASSSNNNNNEDDTVDEDYSVLRMIQSIGSYSPITFASLLHFWGERERSPTTTTTPDSTRERKSSGRSGND
jgi:hypothetical protein